MNGKIKIAIIVILIIALAVAAAVGVWYYKTQFYVPDKNGMVRDMADTVVSCTYSVDGSTKGDSTSVKIYLNENNEVWFDYYRRPYTGAEEENASFPIDSEALEEIRQKCREYGVSGWGELEYSETQTPDAPTQTVSFICGDDEAYSVSSLHNLPEDTADFFSAFYEIFEKYYTQGGN